MPVPLGNCPRTLLSNQGELFFVHTLHTSLIPSLTVTWQANSPGLGSIFDELQCFLTEAFCLLGAISDRT